MELLAKMAEADRELWTEISKLRADVANLTKDVDKLRIKQEQAECDHMFGSIRCFKCNKPKT